MGFQCNKDKPKTYISSGGGRGSLWLGRASPISTGVGLSIPTLGDDSDETFLFDFQKTRCPPPPSDLFTEIQPSFWWRTSFPAFVNRSYYCVDCERGFNTNDSSACGRFVCQDYVRGTQPTDYCTLCHCKFYGAYCKRHHVVTKQRQSVKTCLKCQAQYTVVPERRHKCGHTKCPVCQQWVSIQDHKCYIQPVVEDEEPEPTEEEGGCMVAPPPPLFV